MQIKNITVLSLTGKIDELSGEQLDEYLKSQVHKGNVKLILDFTNVDFTSSGGLRSLLGSIKLMRTNGGDILLANTSPLVHNILKTDGFIDLLKIFSDVDSALTNF